MSVGYRISKVLNAATSSSDRTERSLLVANALAFNVSLCDNDVGATIEAHIGTLREIAKKTNEHVALDIQLLEKHFVQAVKIRYTLLNGTTDPAIIKMAMTSDVANVELGKAEATTINAAFSKTEFYNAQVGLIECVKDCMGVQDE